MAAVDRRNILICAALFLACVVAANPTLEMGFNDDWSYTHVAQQFAATGRFVYDGWTAPMLLPQSALAALFIKAFGFSFLAVRLSTVLLALLLIPVLYGLGRESGLRPNFATFAVLLTIFSPLAFQHEISFMSDVPAFFIFAVCLYAAVKAWTGRIAWIGLVAGAGLVAGLDRQIYWLAPVLFLPTIAWVRRRHRSTVIFAIVSCIAIAIVGAASMRWFAAQPYTLAERPWDAWHNFGAGFLLRRELLLAAQLSTTLALMLLPVLAGFVLPAFRVHRRMFAGLFAAIALIGIAAAYWPKLQAPWMGNTVTEFGAVPQAALAQGDSPLVLTHAIRIALTLAVVLGCMCCGLILRRFRPAPTPLVILGLLFGAAWFPVVLYRSVGNAANDRYVIPFIAIAGIPLLLTLQERVSPRIGRASWIVLAVFSVYATAIAHDAFASARARLDAAKTLESTGISRAEIAAGIEYDGWTQLTLAGHANHELIADYTPIRGCTGPAELRPWYLSSMTALRVRYVITLSPIRGALLAPVTYSTWLPPARHDVFLTTLDEPAACR